MQELTISLRKETDFICMVTEPSVIKRRLSGIPRHYNSIPTTRNNSPRAAIFTSPSIPIQEISNLSHRDLAVGLIKCGTKQTAIKSTYMDIKVLCSGSEHTLPCLFTCDMCACSACFVLYRNIVSLIPALNVCIT